MKKHHLAPHKLTLEVTESAMMHNVQKSLAVVNCIHELGFRSRSTTSAPAIPR